MWLGAMYEYAGMGKPAVSIEILERRKNEMKKREKEKSLDIKIASFKLFFIFILHSSVAFGKDSILMSSNEIIKKNWRKFKPLPKLFALFLNSTTTTTKIKTKNIPNILNFINF